MHKMQAKNQWTDCLATNNGKRPRLNPKSPTTALPYETAVSLAKRSEASSNYGYLFDSNDSYIGLDIDVDAEGLKKNTTKEIPPVLLFFLQANPTHVHYSPSGQGIHIIYKLDDEAKGVMNELNKNQGATSLETGALFNGDWRWNKSFLTFTENLHPVSTSKIATINLSTLEQILGPVKREKKKAKVFDINSGLQVQPVPLSVVELNSTLLEVPVTYNKQAQKACESLNHNVPQSNYDYWVLVGQACASLANDYLSLGQDETDNIELAYVSWSSKDPNFNSIEDVQDKFRGFLSSTREKISNGDSVISYKVLLSLAKGNRVCFPDLRGKKLTPCTVSLKNYMYLADHDGLTFHKDTMGGGYSVSSDSDLIDRWFPGGLEPGVSPVYNLRVLEIRMLPYFQNRFRLPVPSSNSQVALRFLLTMAEESCAFKDWIDSKPWDGVKRLDQVTRSIEYADPVYSDLYESYIRKSLLSMIGIHYWPEDRGKIPAMLVLKGPQHTYKSSWAEWLIPHDKFEYLGLVGTEIMTAGGTERDRFLSTRAVIVVNECETMFSPRYEQKIKSAVDQEVVTYRDLYEPAPISRKRTALVIGTTNKEDLYTGSLGTRKIWQIAVKRCDSYLVKDMDKQQLYAEIKATLAKWKEEHPLGLVQDCWKQSMEELDETEEANRLSKGTMGIDALLIEVFGDPVEKIFDPQDYKGQRGFAPRIAKKVYDMSEKPNAWGLTALLRYMKDRFPDDQIERAKLLYAVRNYAKLYTRTSIEPRKMFGTTKVVFGVVKRSGQDLYLMPPVDQGTPEEFNE